MPSRNRMTFKIGGEAGQGVESGGEGFATALARGGLHIFGLQDYMSRVRGGHNFFQIRVDEQPVYSHSEDVHLLIALVPETIRRHGQEVVDGGGIIYDESFDIDTAAIEGRGVQLFPLPLLDVARELGAEIMANTAAFGAAAGMTGYGLEQIASIVRDNFARKGQDVVDTNLRVAERGHDLARTRYAADFDHKLEAIEAPPRMVINGNQAICLGSLLGGCRFVSAYPMTPSSSIIEWMAAHASDYGVVTKHAEDEVAAMCMAIGANHMGVRGMTATSGGGFSLMVEGLGLAGMTETPVVIVESQRPGPATGMPTRTGQGDLLFAIFASQDEFPRVVLAPGTVEQCFEAGWRSFNLAEIYQVPVIVLVDNYLSNSLRTIERADFHFGDVVIDRGELLSHAELDELPGDYKRYEITESGISPRAVPGHPNAVFMACSDEHDEYGHFEDEDAENRTQMAQKRLRKLKAAEDDMRAPTRYGPEQADFTFVGWGSVCGPVREAMARINENGTSANFLHFSDIWPVPEDRIIPLVEQSRRLVAVENNATGQLARLLRGYAGIEVDQEILRFDGRPLSPEYILERLQLKGGHNG